MRKVITQMGLACSANRRIDCGLEPILPNAAADRLDVPSIARSKVAAALASCHGNRTRTATRCWSVAGRKDWESHLCRNPPRLGRGIFGRIDLGMVRDGFWFFVFEIGNFSRKRFRFWRQVLPCFRPFVGSTVLLSVTEGFEGIGIAPAGQNSLSIHASFRATNVTPFRLKGLSSGDKWKLQSREREIS